MSDSVFFGTPGLTSSEASHVCNVAYEIAESCIRDLNRVTTLTQIAHVKDKTIQVSKANFNADDFKDLAAKAPRLFQLSAWLREAVKEKERLLKETESIVCPPHLLEQFDKQPPLHPAEERDIAVDWGREQLGIKQRAAYLALEAEAAAIGKLLHNDGILQKLRKEKEAKPLQWTEPRVGSESYPIECSVNTEAQKEVDRLFFELQQKHREVSKRLNAIKSQVNDATTAENVRRRRFNKEAAVAFSTDMAKWHAERDAVSNKNQEIMKKWRPEQMEKRNEISSLRIIVPEDLGDILQEVREYSG
jgi:hypothetical protein